MKDPIEKHVIIYDEVNVTRLKTMDFFREFFIQLHSAASETELLYFLSEKKFNPDLLIFYDNFDTEDSFRILSKIHLLKSNLPILVITGNDQKNIFIKAMTEGAWDYILKPVNDSVLLERTLQIINSNNPELTAIPVTNEVNLNLINYLHNELKKAEKGNFVLSVIMTRLFVPGHGKNKSKENILYASEYLYNNFLSILWDTDILVRKDIQTFVGIFPFCGAKNTNKIYKKFLDNFEDALKKNPKLKGFHIAMTSLTFPLTKLDAEEMLDTLEKALKKETDNLSRLIMKYK
jgi:DNA-binding response OmpR family regulator